MDSGLSSWALEAGCGWRSGMVQSPALPIWHMFGAIGLTASGPGASAGARSGHAGSKRMQARVAWRPMAIQGMREFSFAREVCLEHANVIDNG
jgi:hypothetical protein